MYHQLLSLELNGLDADSRFLLVQFVKVFGLEESSIPVNQLSKALWFPTSKLSTHLSRLQEHGWLDRMPHSLFKRGKPRVHYKVSSKLAGLLKEQEITPYLAHAYTSIDMLMQKDAFENRGYANHPIRRTTRLLLSVLIFHANNCGVVRLSSSVICGLTGLSAEKLKYHQQVLLNHGYIHSITPGVTGKLIFGRKPSVMYLDLAWCFSFPITTLIFSRILDGSLLYKFEAKSLFDSVRSLDLSFKLPRRRRQGMPAKRAYIEFKELAAVDVRWCSNEAVVYRGEVISKDSQEKLDKEFSDIGFRSRDAIFVQANWGEFCVQDYLCLLNERPEVWVYLQDALNRYAAVLLPISLELVTGDDKTQVVTNLIEEISDELFGSIAFSEGGESRWGLWRKLFVFLLFFIARNMAEKISRPLECVTPDLELSDASFSILSGASLNQRRSALVIECHFPLQKINHGMPEALELNWQSLNKLSSRSVGLDRSYQPEELYRFGLRTKPKG